MGRLLNLGCGNRLIVAASGFSECINHDRVRHRSEIDVVHDLNSLPWPWNGNEFDHVEAWAVLEHLQIDLVQSFNECWRILSPRGQLRVKLPYWNSEVAHWDPTHRWYVALETLTHFDPDYDRGERFEFYGVKPWRIREWELVADGNSIYGLLEVRK